jgi:hypothetical protein
MDEVQEDTINEDKIAEVLEGKRSHSELTDAELDIAAERQEAARNGNEEEQPTDTSSNEESEEMVEVTPPLPMEDGIETVDKDERIRELLAEKNKLEQIANDRDGKLKKAQEDPEFRKKLFGETVDVQVDENKDYLDESYLATMEAKIERLEQAANDRAERDETSDAERALKKEQLSLFEEINGLQGQYGSLKTSESFQSIDKKVTAWQTTAIENKVDVDKYVEDAEYRKLADSKGHKINVSVEDLKKAWDIYGIYSDYKKEKAEGYKTSLSRVFKEHPMYAKVEKQKYASHLAADDDALAAQLREREAEPMIMSPGSNNATPSEKTFESAIMEMESISMKVATTEADEKRYQELQRVVDSYDTY